MKLTFFYTVFLLFCSSKGNCQKPFEIISDYKYLTKVDTFSTTVKGIFNAYYLDCVHQNYFHEGLGVVEVVIYKDSLHRQSFSLTAILDDRYTDMPTDTYFSLGDKLFLIYKGDTQGIKLNMNISEPAITELKTMLEGRTYMRPPKREKWQEFYDGTGDKIRRKSGKSFNYGNPWNTIIYIFDSPDKYHTLKPL